MEIKFYLKRPKAKETIIFARISYEGRRLKYYTTEKINPKYWSKDSQRAKQTSKFREYPEFNQSLNDLEADIRNVLRKYKNDNDGVPNPETLRELLNKEIKKVEPEKDKLKTFFGFFDELISQSKTGIRPHPKTGRPINENTIKTNSYSVHRRSCLFYNKCKGPNHSCQCFSLRFRY